MRQLLVFICLSLASEFPDVNMKLLACSDLSSLYYEEIADELDSISDSFGHDEMELANYIITNSYEKCMDNLPEGLAAEMSMDYGFELDSTFRSFVEVELGPIKSHSSDLSLTPRQERLVNEFEAELESLASQLENDELFSDFDMENIEDDGFEDFTSSFKPEKAKVQ